MLLSPLLHMWQECDPRRVKGAAGQLLARMLVIVNGMYALLVTVPEALDAASAAAAASTARSGSDEGEQLHAVCAAVRDSCHAHFPFSADAVAGNRAAVAAVTRLNIGVCRLLSLFVSATTTPLRQSVLGFLVKDLQNAADGASEGAARCCSALSPLADAHT